MEIHTSFQNSTKQKKFVNASRGRCGWHVITKRWKVHGISEKIVPTNQQLLLKQVVTTVISWLYMFTKPGGFEEKEEYTLSKSLLLAYIHSHVVKAITVKNDPQRTQRDKILKFLFDHVFVRKEHAIFYLRKHILHFDESTNTNHKGTNNGIKSHLAAVLSMDTTTSAQVMQFQANIVMKEIERMLPHIDYY